MVKWVQEMEKYITLKNELNMLSYFRHPMHSRAAGEFLQDVTQTHRASRAPVEIEDVT